MPVGHDVKRLESEETIPVGSPTLSPGSVQIHCRRPTVEEIATVLAVGADLVAWELDPERDDEHRACAEMVDLVRSEGRQSLIFVRSSHTATLRQAAVMFQPDFLLVSSERDDQALAELCAALPASMGLMLAVPIPTVRPMGKRPPFDSEALACRYSAHATALTLDTCLGDTQKIGLTGHVHDWMISRSIAKQSGVPVVLGGGLSHLNVRQAIQSIRPAGVSACTSLERVGRTQKDPDLCSAFVRAAKAAFEALELAEGPPDVFALPLFPKEAAPPVPGEVTPPEASSKVPRKAVQHPTGVKRAATRKERLGSDPGRKAADSGRKVSASAKKAATPGKKAANPTKRAADPVKTAVENACPRCRAPTWKRTASRPNRTFGRSGVFDQSYVCVDCGFAEVHTVQLA